VTTASRRHDETVTWRRAEPAAPISPIRPSPGRPVAPSPHRLIAASPPRPQAMLFTLWGDYIVHRGGEIWVGSLIRIGAEFGLSEHALRSVLSRMVRTSWLEATRHGNRSYYRLTERGRAVIAEGTTRIFRPRRQPWDGLWHLVSYSVPEAQRELRDRFRKRLSYLGFGALSAGCWITPHDLRDEVVRLTIELGAGGYVEQFRGHYLASSDGRALAARVWPLQRLTEAYRSFARRWRAVWTEAAAGDGPTISDAQAFVLRFWLVHQYQRFFLGDPDLPRELLPSDWPGREVARLFEGLHERLAPSANRFFDAVYQPYPDPSRGAYH
jgi:phenylacetic acid degradation operon negative regulatory protein